MPRSRRISLGLEPLLDRKISQLSGGEQQRVALTRARAKGAELNLMDEPLTNLDYKLREGMRSEIKKAIGAATTIYSTPDPLDVLVISSHVGVIFNGRIVQRGLVNDVYFAPKDVDVANYFSYPAINFLDAHLVESKGKTFLTVDDQIRLDVGFLKGRLTGDKYTLGVRSSDLYEGKTKPGMVSIKLPVDFCEITGSETTVHMTYQDKDIRMWESKILDYEEGKEVEVFISPEDVYVFDQSNNFISRCMRSS